MRTTAVETWVCPRDGESPLDWDGRASSQLLCSTCGALFPVEAGIPDFTGIAASAQELERRHWQQMPPFSATARERYEGQVEQEAILRCLGARPGEHVLDAGCGAGRLTLPLLARGVEVTAVDVSRERLCLLRERAGPGARLHLALAEVTHLPLPSASFDRIVCAQVLGHLPAQRLRDRMMEEFLRLLVPGGRLVLTARNYSRTRRRRGEQRETRHSSGVFDHRYVLREFRRELAGFMVEEIHGVALAIGGGNRLLPYLGRPARWLDHRLEGWAKLSCDRGTFLLARAAKPGFSL